MTHAGLYERMRAFALTFPEAWEDTPWDSAPVTKVRKKIFVHFGHDEAHFAMSCKLPLSALEVLEEPWATPTGYGLGKHGWVSVRLSTGDEVPEARLQEWVEESYRAIAPKTLARQLDG